MKFQSDKVEDFKELFQQRKSKILANKGCEFVQALQDIHEPSTFFTYSKWQSEEDLNNYRNSAFFGETWKLTKAMMHGKASAWSTHEC